MASTQPGTVSSLGDSQPAFTTGPSPWITRLLADVTIQVTVTGNGRVDAVVDVEVSNGPAANPVALDTPAGTITLSSAAGSSSDGFSMIAPWRYVRFNVRSLSGPNAAITSLIGA